MEQPKAGVMEKEENIGALIGIPQEEMAMLLEVKRVQWALFLTGRRSLPPTALLKLSEMLTILKEPDNEAPDDEAIKEEQAQITRYLEKEIIINLNKQQLALNQLERCRKKFQSAQNAMKIANALIAREQQTYTWQKELLPIIKRTAQDVLKKNSVLIQEQYTIKLLVLQQEEVVLRERLWSK